MKNQQELIDIVDISHGFFNMTEWVDMLCSVNPDILFISKICQLSNNICELVHHFIVNSNKVTTEWIKLFSVDLYKLFKLKHIDTYTEPKKVVIHMIKTNIPCFIFSSVGHVYIGYKTGEYCDAHHYNNRESINLIRSRIINHVQYCDINMKSSNANHYKGEVSNKYTLYWSFIALMFNTRFNIQPIDKK